MMRSLYAGVSGLRNHQTRMDVIGNNIANVNTIGYKASRVNFQDVLSQTLQGASAAQGNRGGINPMQVGLGMGLASIDTDFGDGSFQPTGKMTDMAIQGNGFFVLSDGANQFYTRAGNFDFDTAGNFVVSSTGYTVMGWMADASGRINTSASIAPIKIGVGSIMPGAATTTISFAHNLSADASVGTKQQTSITVYDSLGNAHTVNVVFTKVGDNQWLYNVTGDATTGTISNALGEITFNADGTLASLTSLNAPATTTTLTIPNLQLDSTLNSTHTVYYTVLDNNLMPHVFKMTFTNTAANTWSYQLSDASDSTVPPVASGNITWSGTTYTGFPANFTYGANTVSLTVTPTGPAPGAFQAAANPIYNTTTLTPISFTPTGGANPLTISLGMNSLTQYGGESTVQAVDQDGFAAGQLDTITINTAGVIVGHFTNGKTQNLAQVALSTFNNPGGLLRYGDSMFIQSTNSGEPQIGPTGSGGRGTINPGTLEMSNVDLAQQFSDMIVTQRGFQANSKIITVVDEMLQDLVNLKR